jgi:TolB-like protein/Tfp pilus assembly protein PilF
MNPGNFFAELKRRNVYKVAVAYAVVGWLLVQIATQVFPFFDIPAWAVRLVVLAIVIGFPIALVIAWAFETTPEGIKRTDVADVARQHSRGGAWIYIVIVGVALSLGLFFLGRFSGRHAQQSASSDVSSKSIAVLPFESLSSDKENAYFASGIQDEILTKLAKIGALKVISRSSTKQYESKPGNLRDIGQQLGVANVLEGSVQKAGDVVHINVQLIRAASDEHLWAESYSRSLTDIFAVEAELAGSIADALKAKLTGAEEKALEARPTTNVAAYAAYLRGRAIEADSYDYVSYSRGAAEYAQAVRVDPKFAVAWARLAILRSFLHFNGIDLGANSAAAVKEAADQAFTLQPDLAEGWLAQGVYRYRVLHDFSSAVAAFEEARRRMPNNSDVLAQMAMVERRLGRWSDAEKHCREAVELDPRNVGFLEAFGGELFFPLRRFADAHAQIDQALRIVPGNASALAYKAAVYQEQGRLNEAAKVVAQIAPDERDETVMETCTLQLIYERRFDAAVARLAIDTAAPKSGEPLNGHRKALLTMLGNCENWAGRSPEARAAFERAVREIKPAPDSTVTVDQSFLPMNLALAYAGLGDKQRALDAAHAAIAAYENDAVSKPYAETVLAQIQARFGEIDVAIAALPHLLEVPGAYPLTPAILRLDPMWDPLRNDPHFQKLSQEKPQ